MGTKKLTVAQRVGRVEKGLENTAAYIGNLANSHVSNSIVIDALIEFVEKISGNENFLKEFEVRVKELMEERHKQIQESNAANVSPDTVQD